MSVRRLRWRALRVSRAGRMRLLRERRSWERAKVRREVFAMHAEGLRCHVGSRCVGWL